MDVNFLGQQEKNKTMKTDGKVSRILVIISIFLKVTSTIIFCLFFVVSYFLSFKFSQFDRFAILIILFLLSLSMFIDLKELRSRSIIKRKWFYTQIMYLIIIISSIVSNNLFPNLDIKSQFIIYAIAVLSITIYGFYPTKRERGANR